MRKLGPSSIKKYSFVLDRSKTSISLEPQFMDALRSIARVLGIPLTHLVRSIDNRREHNNLSSACRLHVLKYYKDIADLATGGRK